MRITDELRLFAADPYTGWVPTDKQQADLRAIADRIDAEHERECKEQYACGAEHGIGASIDASMIQTHGYVELPKDADGEHIHIGDVMENVVCPPVHREVTGVGVECFYGWDEGNGRYSQFSANCYRHYHAPTVEDVLREFADEVYADAGNEIRDRDFLCAKYAQRLTLAGDAE